ncbi:MAG TPA: 3-deoxy-D-manno-octulosonic acid transferase [Pirellulales bacterium]|nr:3-deoxy-D-manno-octulosonic acid transferase [Pirellulales bacterium]
MTALFLNAAYFLTLIVAAPWLIYQSVFRGKYREGFAAKFWGAAPRRNSNRPCIWLHAVSVGEVNLLGVLLKHIAMHRPDVECVISTTTKTGYDLAKSKYAQYTVFYCPLDFSWAVRRAMNRIRPSLLVLAELELWPNLVRAAREHGARVGIVNGRLSEKSFRGYHHIRRWLLPVLNSIDVIAVQNEEYAQRFRNLGVEPERVCVTGSLKFDGAQCDRHNPRTQSLRKLAGFSADDVVFLAGSTQQPEEQLALAAFQSLAGEYPQLRLVIVPRHPHRFDEVAALLDRSGLKWQRRSALSESTNSPLTTHSSSPVLLVDTVGELGAWWGTATIGFVGGSLFSSRGGQNMIEPAAYGVALCFGPNTQNFRDVVALLLANDAAVRVASGEELTAFVRRCLSDTAYADGLGRNAVELVKAQQGATARTWARIEPLLPQPVIQLEAANRPAA